MSDLAEALAGEGYDVQFVAVSNQNASDFVERTTLPIFQDDAPGRPAWNEMEDGARKHDTFVYSRTGERVLFWDASSNSLGSWSDDIRAAVEAQGL
ncbi:MAG: hypothetical protein KJO07_05905 [Deltaproteobacteria bacterium]|nr:hypothetical protein [Deltaproteobacteria bacterium]